MSTYLMADLHGCHDKYLKMLEKIEFKDEDTLYVIGDIIDRGTQNLKLIRDIKSRDNVVLICGNHENMMVAAIVEMSTLAGKGEVITGDTLRIQNWMTNGGGTTYTELFENKEDEKQIKDLGEIFEWFVNLPTYEEVTVAGKDYVLVHAGVGDYEDDVPMEERDELEFLWDRKRLGRIKDKIIVGGHTPTPYLNADGSYNIYKSKDYINLDGGCVFPAGQLNCLRLDDMKEFVVK